MVYQEDFLVERWMDEFETKVDYNIAETCCYSYSLNQVAELVGEAVPLEQIANKRLTYGDIPGSKELLSTIADLTNEGSNGPHKVTGENVIVTNGGIGANFLLYYTLVGPGDHVIVVDPAYQQLNSVPAVFGGQVEKLVLRPENNYLPDIEELKKMVVKGKTKLININNPHNPSGSVIPEGILTQIVDIAREADAYVVCDEVYRPLYHSLPAGMAEPSSIATLYEKGISTSSVSKAYGLAGLRLGWIATPDKSVIEECSKRRDYSTICVSSVNDILANWALSNRHKLLEANKRMCVEQLDILDKFVQASNGALTYVKPQAGTTVFVKITGCSDTEAFCRELANQYKTLAVPGETFGYPGYLRIGYANHRSELIAGLENIKQLLIKSGRLPKDHKGWN